MGKIVRVAGIDDLPDGSMKKYQVEGTEILLVRIAGNFHAVQNKCPHFGGDLSAGTLDGTVVTCPRHGSRFDVTNGNVVRWLKGSGIVASIGKTLKPEKNLTTYTVEIKGQDVMVDV